MNDPTATARKKLEERNTPFTVAAFRKAMRDHRDVEVFVLFLRAGILSKVRTQQDLLAHCFKVGSAEMAALMVRELDGVPVSGRAFFELVARATFEDWKSERSKDVRSKDVWRQLVTQLLPLAEDVDFCKQYRARIDGKSIEEFFTPLLHVVYRQDVDLVSQLVSMGANVNRPYPDDKLKNGNVMHFLCAFPRPPAGIIACLLRAGIDLNHRDEKGYTPLCIAARNTNWQCVRASAGAAPAPDFEGREQLLALVKQLVEHGADINAPSGQEGDRSILIESIWQKNFEIADYLIDAGADIHVRTGFGWTAGRVAFDLKQKALGEKLIARGARLHPYIGIFADPQENEKRVLVKQLDPQGSAQSAGIRVGDVIEAVNDVPVRSVEELKEELARFRPLDQIPFSVRRDGESNRILVELQTL